MTGHEVSVEEYRRQLNEWVAALAVADDEAVTDVAPGYTASDVHLFTEGNLGKRADILDLQLSFLKNAFEDLDELIEEYITTQPLSAFGSGPPDAAAMLRWLCDEIETTAEQRDHIECRLARYGVEDAAREKRREHVRFQERLSVAKRLGRDLGKKRLTIHLNPALAWATLATRALVDDAAALPAQVAFFAAGLEIRSAVLDEPVPGLMRLLGDEGMSLDQLAARAGVDDVSKLLALTRRLAEMGLVAFS